MRHSGARSVARYTRAALAGSARTGADFCESLESRVLLAATVHLGIIGDIAAGTPAQSVAQLVTSWSPDAILSVGDNTYATNGTAAYDGSIGQNYHNYLYPYTGAFGNGSADHANHFFPALGNHDWDNNNGQSFLSFFSLPNNGRYYTVTVGNVAVFVVDSDPREPDGVSSTSTQARWLQSALGASTATWKLVLAHHPPYSSGSIGSNSYMQWPFAQWGATAVFAGHDHDYERLSVNGLPYVIDGLGGAPIVGFGSTVSGSQVRYNGDYGAMLLTATSTSLSAQFVTQAGKVIDSFTLGQVTPPTIPTAPSNLTVTAASASQINLTWANTATNATGSKIERSTDGTTFSALTSVASGVSAYQDIGLSSGTKYYYRVKASNSAGDSAPSAVANATTLFPAVLTYLSDLTWTSATVGWGTIHKDASISGNPLTLDGVTYAKGLGTHAISTIVYALGGQYSRFLTDIGIDGEELLHGSVDFQVLTDGVKVYDSGVMTPASTTQSLNLNVAGVQQLTLTVTDGGDGIDYDHADWAGARLTSALIAPAVPTAPTSLAATAISGTQINLAWSDKANDQTSFKIQRSTDNSHFTQIGTTAANVLTYADLAVTAGTTYYYRVLASNAVGDSTPSNVASTASLTPPAAPSQLVATAPASTQINLSWTNNAGNETGFILERSTDNLTFSQLASLDAQAVSYSDTTVAANTAYYYRVAAANAAGRSAYSNVAFATTPQSAIPAPPSNLLATTASATGINLTWTNLSPNDTGIKIERSTNGTTFTQIALTAAHATAYADTTLAPSTVYTYRVRATNALGDSGYSNLASATTTAAPATTYLSDLAWVSASNGWGPVERDMSNGSLNAGDGHTLTLNGVTYAKGIGCHAVSQIVITLGGKYASFLSDIGIDDEVGNKGSVIFQVWADGVKIFDSGAMTGASATQHLSLSVKGVNQLTLLATNGSSGIDYDHADWAGARLTTT